MKNKEIGHSTTNKCIKHILGTIFLLKCLFWYLTGRRKKNNPGGLIHCPYVLFHSLQLNWSPALSWFSSPNLSLFIPSLREYNLKNTPLPWARTNKVWLVLLDELFDQTNAFKLELGLGWWEQEIEDWELADIHLSHTELRIVSYLYLSGMP